MSQLEHQIKVINLNFEVNYSILMLYEDGIFWGQRIMEKLEDYNWHLVNQL